MVEYDLRGVEKVLVSECSSVMTSGDDINKIVARGDQLLVADDDDTCDRLIPHQNLNIW